MTIRRASRPGPFPGLVLLLLAASLGLNVYLFQLGRTYYLQLNDTRLDPLGVEVYPSREIGASRIDRPVVVLVGDSRAAEWPAPALPAGGTVLNRGIGAQTSTQVLGRFDEDVAPWQPDIVVLQAGINDLKTLPFFEDRERRIIATCIRNLAEIVERSQRLGAHVIITTIVPLGRPSLVRRLVGSARVRAAIDEVNGYISSIESDHVTVLDTGLILADDDGTVLRRYGRDFLHLTPEGYAALNQALEPEISSVTRQRDRTRQP